MTGDPPLRRPARLPTALALNEMILMDFVGYKGIGILHIMDAFAKFAIAVEVTQVTHCLRTTPG